MRGSDAFHAGVKSAAARKQRREVIAKHTKKGTAPTLVDAPAPADAVAGKPAQPALDAARAKAREKRTRRGGRRSGAREAALFGGLKPSARRSRESDHCRRRHCRCPTRSRPPRRRPTAQRRLRLPPAALLDAPKTIRKIDERELMDGARLLEEKCREFSRRSSVAQIHPGPVVTTFEFKPDAA